LPAERRLEAALEAVRGEVARVLSMDGAQAVGMDRPLKELGLDSMMALELRNALGKRVGATLPATLAFDYPTPAAIAKHLITMVSSRRVITNDHTTMRTPQQIVAAKLGEAAIELRKLFHDGTVGERPNELDDATRASIEDFARVFTERLVELKNSKDRCDPICLRSASAPTMRLFCFPYAGGGAASFEKWSPYLPENIELHAFPYDTVRRQGACLQV
jgi:acyl carrier protein